MRPVALTLTLSLATTSPALSQIGGPSLIGGGASPTAPTLADVDGDGDLDVVYADPPANAIDWLENSGEGIFGLPRPISLLAAEVTEILAVDLDGDADMDLVVRSNTAPALTTYENLGSGTFGPRQVVARPATLSFARIRGLAAEDVDGDGDVDLVEGVTYSQGLVTFMAVRLYTNDGTGGFAAAATLFSDPNLEDRGISDLAATDMDGDGDIDVVVSTTVTSIALPRAGVQVLVNDGGSSNWSWVAVEGSLPGTQAVITGDLDDNGAQDILLAADGRVLFYGGTGTLTFAPGASLVDGPPIRSLATADMDADGRLDLLRTLDTESTVLVDLLRGDDPAPRLELIYAIASGPSSVATGDVDGNGFTDLVAAGGGAIALFLDSISDCNGNGFSDSADIAAGLAQDCDGNLVPDSCQITQDPAADFNGNGVLDVCEEIGNRVCSPNVPNSTGDPARLGIFGSEVLFLNDVTLTARDLPAQTLAMFIASRTQNTTATVANSQGALCLAGLVGRFAAPGQVRPSGTLGLAELSIDLYDMPCPLGPVVALPGETWFFQAWYRDVDPLPTSNFTDAVGILIR